MPHKGHLGLHALVISAPDGIRQRLRALPLGQLLRTCAGLRGSMRHTVEESATISALRSTARRAIACEQEATELEAQLATLVRQLAPTCSGCDSYGVCLYLSPVNLLRRNWIPR